MDALRGSYKVHFVLAWAVSVIALLFMASTWLPGPHVVNRWVVIPLVIAAIPIFGVALIRSMITGAAVPTGRRGRYNLDLTAYVVLPTWLKIAYPLIIGCAVVGVATGSNSAHDVHKGASGYYSNSWDKSVSPAQEVRTPISEAAYYTDEKGLLRVLSGIPPLACTVSSFVVFASAKAAAAQEAVDAAAASRESVLAKRRERSARRATTAKRRAHH